MCSEGIKANVAAAAAVMSKYADASSENYQLITGLFSCEALSLFIMFPFTYHMRLTNASVFVSV